MIQIREYLTTKIVKSTIKATNDTIKRIVKDEMDKYGHSCDLNHIDVSEVTDMSNLFSCDYLNFGKEYFDLNPNISEWNVSNVTDMGYMFFSSRKFDCDISEWDVSNVENMEGMFRLCLKFNSNISKWDVSNVENMSEMFSDCGNFCQDLSKWNVSNVIAYDIIFQECPLEWKENYQPKFK